MKYVFVDIGRHSALAFAKCFLICSLTLLPAAAQVTFNFSTPVQLANTDTPGKWYIDRFPPNGFVSPVTAPNGTPNTLEESIAAGDVQAGTSFYNTQGRDFDLPTGSTSVTIALYVPAAWETENARTAGFWTCAVVSGACTGSGDYPIIEFQGPITSQPANGPSYQPNGGVPGFYGWNNVTGTFDFIGLPVGFTYNSFVQLTIAIVGGQFVYTVGDPSSGGSVSLDSPFNVAGDTALTQVLLEGYNYGFNYSIFWSGTPFVTPGQDGVFQIGYAANLNIGDSVLNVTNNGANGGFYRNGTVGNLCVNVYTFDPGEEEVACCSCLVTPNGLDSLSAKKDLVSNTLTPAPPTSIVIKLTSNRLCGAPHNRFNAESRFMLSPDSDPAIFSQVEGLSLRITGVAFSMAIN
ncbi:MAG: hypothetical protein ABSB35_26100 [Bryobacteraceae bacterium]|jgi:hypothetical protein